jgi:DNA modification methylase
MKLILGECRAEMRKLIDRGVQVDSIVCDPPYELGFMGKSWDKSGVAFDPETWRLALELLKPGGHLLAFSGSRTYHRMAVAIEDAGFEIRDQIMWVYGSGFPKSHDVAKAIDKAVGSVHSQKKNKGTKSINSYKDGLNVNYAARPKHKPASRAAKQWQGWGTALKPAHEPIVLARKPLTGTVAENVLEHGTGALNIDGCRIDAEKKTGWGGGAWGAIMDRGEARQVDGRFPANLIHDGSDEVVSLFPESNGSGGSIPRVKTTGYGSRIGTGKSDYIGGERTTHDAGKGSAARFFYCPKASKSDRGEGNTHPTVKPTDLMRYLCRLITPPGGTVLDPFMGSGSTGKAARLEGFDFIGIEMSSDYIEIAKRRIKVK